MAVKLDDAPLRESTDPKREIKPERTSRDGLDISPRFVAKLQYRHLSELLPDFLHHVFKCHGCFPFELNSRLLFSRVATFAKATAAEEHVERVEFLHVLPVLHGYPQRTYRSFFSNS